MGVSSGAHTLWDTIYRGVPYTVGIYCVFIPCETNSHFIYRGVLYTVGNMSPMVYTEVPHGISHFVYTVGGIPWGNLGLTMYYDVLTH